MGEEGGEEGGEEDDGGGVGRGGGVLDDCNVYRSKQESAGVH